MTRLLSALALTAIAALAACARHKAPAPIAATPPEPCRIKTLDPLVGRPGSAVLAAEALTKSGARTVRWVRPHEAVTMDFREDRLNINLDEDDLVKEFTCG